MSFKYSIQKNDPTRCMDLVLETPLPAPFVDPSLLNIGDVSRYLSIMNLDMLDRINQCAFEIAKCFKDKHKKLSIKKENVYIIPDNRQAVVAVIVYDAEIQKAFCAGWVKARTTDSIDPSAGPILLDGHVSDTELPQYD